MEFPQITKNPAQLRDLLDNCSFSGSFEAWKKRKEFIAQAIHKDGTILDIGCGNGFLLRCLQEWSGRQLITYGIDINEAFIKKAKELFAESADHFAVLDASNIEQLSGLSIPDSYDFVYFSSKWTAESALQAKPMIDRLCKLVSPEGRLVIGFYDDDADTNNRAREAMKSVGIRFSEKVSNPNGTNLIAWIDKD